MNKQAWLTIAQFEWKQSVRQLWMIVFTFLLLLFQGLFLMSEFFSSGAPGFTGFNRLTGQMLNMNLILLSIMAMLIGSLSMSGDKEDQQWLLLKTYPLSYNQLIWGKFAGLSLAFTGIISFSYGLLGLVSFLLLPGGSAEKWLLFLLGSLVLVFIYLAIGIAIGNMAATRLQAIAGTVVVWFISLFVLPFVTINIALILPVGWIKGFILTFAVINPVEFIRIATIFLLGNGAILGTPYYDLNQWFSTSYGYLSVIIYAILFSSLFLKGASLIGRGK